jgi:pimeloyl-ACP methyl ester carboxylesterase
MGGLVALETALAAPGRVDGLVLIGTAVRGAPYPYGDPAPGEEALDEAAEAAGERGDTDEANRLEAHLWLDGPREPEGRVGDPARQLFLDMNAIALSAPDVGQASWPPSSDRSTWDRAGDITAPTLVIIGRHDMTLGNAWSQGLADRLADATLVELPDSAHLPSLDDPEGLIAVMRPFVDRLRGAG